MWQAHATFTGNWDDYKSIIDNGLYNLDLSSFHTYSVPVHWHGLCPYLQEDREQEVYVKSLMYHLGATSKVVSVVYVRNFVIWMTYLCCLICALNIN